MSEGPTDPSFAAQPSGADQPDPYRPVAYPSAPGSQSAPAPQPASAPQFASGYPAQDPQAKSKMAAGLLGIFLGGLGVHRFYLGFTGIGLAQIAVTLVTCGAGSLWGFIEGILYLTGSGSYTRDASGRPLRD